MPKGPQDRLTLKDTQKSGRMAEFIAQEEKRLPTGSDKSRFDKAVKAAIKPLQSKRQTSRSPSSDGSPGKRTR